MRKISQQVTSFSSLNNQLIIMEVVLVGDYHEGFVLGVYCDLYNSTDYEKAKGSMEVEFPQLLVLVDLTRFQKSVQKRLLKLCHSRDDLILVNQF